MNVASDFECFGNSPVQSRVKHRAALAFSFVSHSLLLVTIYLLILFSHREPTATAIPETDRPAEIVLVTNAAERQALFQTGVVQQSSESVQSDLGKAASELSDMLPTAAALSSMSIAEIELPLEQNSAPQSQATHRDLLVGRKISRSAAGPTPLSEEDAAMVAAERARMESLLPQGDPVQISLFGVGDTPGHTFVFLLDRSKSMGENGLNVLEAAKAELMKAAGKLQSNHRFQIIAYDDKTVFVGPQRQLLKPSAETMRQVGEYLQGVYAARGTSHTNALSVAIGLRPDVIFLLTDAGLPTPAAGEIAQILAFAKDKTTVHCIQFGNEPAGAIAEFLLDLAEQTGGQARFLRVSQDRKIATQPQ